MPCGFCKLLVRGMCVCCVLWICLVLRVFACLLVMWRWWSFQSELVVPEDPKGCKGRRGEVLCKESVSLCFGGKKGKVREERRAAVYVQVRKK